MFKLMRSLCNCKDREKKLKQTKGRNLEKHNDSEIVSDFKRSLTSLGNFKHHPEQGQW